MKNKPIIIGLDMDDTITTFLEIVVDEYNDLYGTNHNVEEITTWEIPPQFEHGLFSVFDKREHVILKCPLKEYALETIKYWYSLGFEIVIVTGVQDTQSYIDKLRLLDKVGLTPYIKEVIPSKHKYLINCDIFVDDNVDYLTKWQEYHPEGRAYLFNARHNQKCNDFCRVNNWKELRYLVDIYLRFHGKI